MRVKFWQVGLMTSLLTISLSLPALAGQWKEEDCGWKYVENDGTILTDSWRISEDKKTSLLNRLKEKKKEINQTRKVKKKIKYSQNNIER